MTRTHKLIGSPIGELTLVATDGVLDGLYMEGHTHMPDPATFGEPTATGFEEVEEQLAEYFAGERTIGSDGTLTGYAGGLDRKWFLLDLEAPDGQRPARLF